MASKFLLEYEGEWKIQTPVKPKEFKNILIPAFSPLPDNTVSFRFEAWYQNVNDYTDLFKLKLVKLSSDSVSQTLEVDGIVKVEFYDGTIFSEYQLSPSKKVGEMNEVTFPDKILSYDNGAFWNKIRSRSELNVTCKITFFDQNKTSHFLPGIETTTSNKNFGLIQNLKSMYNSAMFSDFTFEVGDTSFPAHKVILSAHSSVFSKMFIHDFKESKNNRVTITDATPEAVGMFLSYLYSGEIEDESWESLKAVHYLADKYDVGILKNECADKAIAVLSVDLVCDVLQFAYTYSNDRLKKAAINYAVNHVVELAQREDWKELSNNNTKIGYDVAINFMPR